MRTVTGVHPVIIMSERAKYIDVALIYELWSEYADAVNEGDLERWISFWIDDGIQMPPKRSPRIGKGRILEAMQLRFDLFATCKMAIDTDEVQILGDRAYAYGTYTFEGISKEGGPSISYSGSFLDILEKQVDCSWKIAIECRSYYESSA